MIKIEKIKEMFRTLSRIRCKEIRLDQKNFCELYNLMMKNSDHFLDKHNMYGLNYTPYEIEQFFVFGVKVYKKENNESK